MCKPAPSTSTVLEKAEAIDNSKTTEYGHNDFDDGDHYYKNVQQTPMPHHHHQHHIQHQKRHNQYQNCVY